jgi:hypothetical protein
LIFSEPIRTFARTFNLGQKETEMQKRTGFGVIVAGAMVVAASMLSWASRAEASEPRLENVVLTYDRVIPSFSSTFALLDGSRVVNMMMDEKTCQTVRVWDDGTVLCMKNGQAQEVGTVGTQVPVIGSHWAFLINWKSNVELVTEVVAGFGSVTFIRVK